MEEPIMDKITAEAIALFRHQLISPVLAEPGRKQMKYFRKMEKNTWDVPGRGLQKFKAATIKSWLCSYKRNGFEGLLPKERKDTGSFRKLKDEHKKEIIKLRHEHMGVPVSRFYEKCRKKKILGRPMICEATLRRLLKMEGLFEKKSPKARKRFEMSRFGELWTGDFMHGPMVLHGKRQRKAILFAIIDDFSRVIVGARFGFRETTLFVENVFKDTIIRFGVPDRLYVDNGSAFSSQYLSRVCANLNVGLVHSKPYDSPSRGKIERFFRTVRETFLSEFKQNEIITVDELNDKFLIWLRDEYHHKPHRGINARPIDRYHTSTTRYPLKRIEPERISEFFMVSIKRKAIKDATVSYLGVHYEVPSHYIGKTIEIRHVQGDTSNIYIYEDDIRKCRITPVDSRYNAKIYKPDKERHVSFHNPEDL
jgi:transposase InsO family protein